MTRYAVPGDDLPPGPRPPAQGPGSDERDLELLLSGPAGGRPGPAYGVPPALLPVAGVLAALRAGPARGELAGEAGARAVFRAFSPFPALPPVPAPRAVEAEHGTVPREALVFPAVGRRPRDPARHRRRHRRGAGAGAARRLAVAAGAAAAVTALVIAAALAGGLGRSSPQRPLSASASVTGSAWPSVTQRVDGRASRVPAGAASPAEQAAPAVPAAAPAPSASAAPSATTPNPAALCREYFSLDFYRDRHREPPAARAARAALRRILAALAGGPVKIYPFCRPYLSGRSGDERPRPRPTRSWP